ncbi:hypothetical protein OX88_21620 [Pseudomonas coronafaciens pv. porri]|uniref:hypothetical protein n=1 Tax=Pseudomonas coronafaciens TaxID=53409 RepID=UPI0006ABE1BC|nr:hypothetical protein [Pseudomonas coronafaciens]KOP53089.1 hypothetical protein OX88_21620 [Pseudomonas coronafaciens pv. porri]
MSTHALPSEEIIKTLKDSTEYELNRNKNKYSKLIIDAQKVLAKLEAEELKLKSNAYDLLDSPDALSELKQLISSNGLLIQTAFDDVSAYEDVLNYIHKALDEILTKKNHEQILKYLKSQGYTTVEQVKAALSQNH